MSEFEQELTSLLNKHSKESVSNTPDFILARYLSGCLRLFNATVVHRAGWYGRIDKPGQGIPRQLERDNQGPSPIIESS